MYVTRIYLPDDISIGEDVFAQLTLCPLSAHKHARTHAQTHTLREISATKMTEIPRTGGVVPERTVAL